MLKLCIMCSFTFYCLKLHGHFQRTCGDSQLTTTHCPGAIHVSFLPSLMVVLEGHHFLPSFSFCLFPGSKNAREELQVHNIN